jgi:small subunit ribosomal protein S4
MVVVVPQDQGEYKNMGKKLGPQCKQCRREGKKLFLKGERCFTSKCAMVKRNYPPGAHGITKRKPRVTEYGLQLREKQKAKRIYGILERQFRNYYRKAIKKVGDTGEILFQFLEQRLDNVVYRLGFAKSRKLARQLVNHGHFLVNGKKVDIPSFELKLGDIVSIKESSLKLAPFKDLSEVLKKQETVAWLSLDPKTLEGKVLVKPTKEDLAEAFDVKLIVEYYSR